MTGAGGQLGRAVCAQASDVLALRHSDLDIVDAEAVRAVLRPGDVVLNCAAYTAVDAAETHVAAAFSGNETGPAVLASACRAVGANMIHVSTDYVFDGAARRPYEPSDTAEPVSVYGRSKLSGEHAVLRLAPHARVVRTAWVYTGDQGDFVAAMRRRERDQVTVEAVADQIGSPTYAPDLAAGLLELADWMGRGQSPAQRVLHLTNAGEASRFDLAREVFAAAGADPGRVRPCSSDAFPAAAHRPPYSVLSHRSWVKAGLTPLRDWRDAVHAALAAH